MLMFVFCEQRSYIAVNSAESPIIQKSICLTGLHQATKGNHCNYLNIKMIKKTTIFMPKQFLKKSFFNLLAKNWKGKSF